MSAARRAGAHPYFDHPTPLALAHRGYSSDGLENSMVAFAAAVELGYTHVETDVHATSDGVALAFHDTTLDRVTDRTGVVGAQAWSQVRQARINGREPIPTVEDLLGAWSDLRVNLDVKSAAAIAPLARAIERTRAHDRVCVASFSDSRRRAVLRRLSRPVARSAGRRTVASFRAVSTLRWTGMARLCLRDVDCLQVPTSYRGVRVVTSKTIAAAHATGRHLHVWTINDIDEMRKLLDLGVDGIVTDRPDVLRDVLVERGTWRS